MQTSKSATARTLPALLRERAAREPNRVVYTFLGERGAAGRDVTLGELDATARAFAARLSEHCAPGARALVVLPSGPGFLFSFFGCIYAGVVAVPTPEPARPRERERLIRILGSAAPACLIGSRSLLDAAGALGLALPGFAPEEVSAGGAGAYSAVAEDPGALAFLQYTSGSTGDPKGVMVSHANIMANEAMIQRAFGNLEGSNAVGWLPHFHDMGLLGNLLQPLYAGIHIYLFSPLGFLRDPLRWLRCISQHRARSSGGPNFAYDLCVRHHDRLAQALDIDLSCWEVAFMGAEPIRPATTRAFADLFGRYGFDQRAFLPCYGLAEATLFVSGGGKGNGARIREIATSEGRAPRALVGCGMPAAELDVRIVDARSGRQLTDGIEGEILVAGPSVAGGYWQRPTETTATFQQRVAGSDAPFLRTGDLGVRQGTELYITGRLRDLIIVRGHNHYPHDIEAAMEGVRDAALRTRYAAAFAFEHDGAERTALVCEVGAPLSSADELCAALRAAVADAQDLDIDVVVLIRARTLPMTTSGKVERRTTRQAFLDGALEVVAASSRITADEPWSRALAPFEARAAEPPAAQSAAR